VPAEPAPVEPVAAEGTSPVPVMDDRPTKLAQAWSAWNASIKAADEAAAAAAAADEQPMSEADPSAESTPVPSPAGYVAPSPQQNQSSGPIGWLRRGNDHNGS
jgi:hypothetical protein